MAYLNPTDFFSQEDYEAAQDEMLFGGLATPNDARREYASNAGYENKDRQWILTPWDTWEQNPYYSGPPQRHPEADYDDEDHGDEISLNRAAYYPQTVFGLIEETDDDIPF